MLCSLARDAEKHEALSALNDIGTALYEFRRHVKQLQEAHRKKRCGSMMTRRKIKQLLGLTLFCETQTLYFSGLQSLKNCKTGV